MSNFVETKQIPHQSFSQENFKPLFDINKESEKRMGFCIFNTFQVHVQRSLHYLSCYFERTTLYPSKPNGVGVLDFHLERLQKIDSELFENKILSLQDNLGKLESSFEQDTKRKVFARGAFRYLRGESKKVFLEIKVLRKERLRVSSERRNEINETLKGLYRKGHEITAQSNTFLDQEEGFKAAHKKRVIERKTLKKKHLGLIKLLPYFTFLVEFKDQLKPFESVCRAYKNEYTTDDRFIINKVSSRNLNLLFYEAIKNLNAMKYMTDSGFSIKYFIEQAHLEWTIDELEETSESFSTVMKKRFPQLDLPFEQTAEKTFKLLSLPLSVI